MCAISFRTALPMRFLHSADWHLGRILYGVSLLDDQAHILAEFVRLVGEVRPDAILLAGDIYDRAVPPAAAVRLLDSVLTELVCGLRIPVVMIAGNHDGPDRLGFGAELLVAAGLVVRAALSAEPAPLLLHDAHGAVAIHALPYAEPLLARAVFADDETAGASDDASTAPATPAIQSHSAALAAQLAAARRQHPAGARAVVLAHAFVQGGEESESERPLTVGGSGLVPASLFDGFHYVALGHLHRPQQVGDARIQYSGSLLKYSFDEVDQRKSVSLVELDAAGRCTVERIALTPRRDVRVLDGELDALLALVDTGRGRDDYVLARLRDRGALLDVMGRLRQAYPNALAIERPALLGDAGAQRPADRRGVSAEELFASFHQQTSGATLSAAERAALARVLERVDFEARQA